MGLFGEIIYEEMGERVLIATVYEYCGSASRKNVIVRELRVES